MGVRLIERLWMSAPFVLSICVPSRNRQKYFKQTIAALISNPRTDVEFVFVDNSDAPDEMRDFMKAYEEDRRIKFIPAGERIYSMLDNWERTVAASTGEWVTVIGDDDYADPDVALLIPKILDVIPHTDAISWNRMVYAWPGANPLPSSVPVPVGSQIVEVSQKLLLNRMFGWEGATFLPECLFSIYHGCIRRSLLDTIRQKNGGRYFEYPTVDFDMAFKVLTTGETFISIERSFSILGACPESNSASIGRIEDLKKKHAAFQKDLGRNMDQDPVMRGFPFPTILGVSAAILAAQHWFKTTYGFVYTGFEKNFAKACEKNCETAIDEEAFEFYANGYRDAFRIWDGGKHLKHFNPVFRKRDFSLPAFLGMHEQLAFVAEDIGGAQNPHELYQLVSGMMDAPEDIPIVIRKVGFDM
jgi:glycosyltransferase involved in cell wall biosynthesis